MSDIHLGGASGPTITPVRGDEISAEDVDPAIAEASNSNPSLFATKRANADGNPKWIKASIKGHTDAATGVTNWTDVVDDVFSQHANGDCLPPDIQQRRQELKNVMTYGSTEEGARAAAELTEIDHTIVACAEVQEDHGVQTQTFDQRRRSEFEQSIFQSLTNAILKNSDMGMDMGVMGPMMNDLTNTMAEADPSTDEYKDAMLAMEDLNSAAKAMADDPSQEKMAAFNEMAAKATEKAHNCPRKHHD